MTRRPSLWPVVGAVALAFLAGFLDGWDHATPEKPSATQAVCDTDRDCEEYDSRATRSPPR